MNFILACYEFISKAVWWAIQLFDRIFIQWASSKGKIHVCLRVWHPQEKLMCSWSHFMIQKHSFWSLTKEEIAGSREAVDMERATGFLLLFVSLLQIPIFQNHKRFKKYYLICCASHAVTLALQYVVRQAGIISNCCRKMSCMPKKSLIICLKTILLRHITNEHVALP